MDGWLDDIINNITYGLTHNCQTVFGEVALVSSLASRLLGYSSPLSCGATFFELPYSCLLAMFAASAQYAQIIAMHQP